MELTAFSKGPVIRAEAAAEDKMGALDLALDKMAAQMRRAADRRRVHHGRTPSRWARRWPACARRRPPTTRRATLERKVGPITSPATVRSWCARRRTRPSPMTLDQALYEMELVGHDFYLFVDKESERPSVVYRRRGYDYGVISLDLGRRTELTLAPGDGLARAGQTPHDVRGSPDTRHRQARPCHDAVVAVHDKPSTRRADPGARRRRSGAVPSRADDAARRRAGHRGRR